MKRLTLLLLALTLTACESSRTVNGKDVPCYGLNGDPQPGLKYDWSLRNIIIGVAFGPITSIVVAVKEAKCPRTSQ